MLSKGLMFVIAAVIVGGAAAAGVTTYYFLGNSSTPEMQNNTASGGNHTSGNRIAITNHGYFFGPDPRNPFRETTYVYLQLSDKLILNDFIRIHYGSQDLARWWVNRSQAYHTEISVPLNVLTNLNGSLDVEIIRGNTTLYSGKVAFSTNVNVAVKLMEISYYPLNYRFADLGNVTVWISSSRDIYVSSLSARIGNATSFEEIKSVVSSEYVHLNLVERKNNTIIFGPIAFKKGTYPVNISLKYPLFPSPGYAYVNVTVPYTLNFTCHNVSIAGVDLEDTGYDQSILTFHFDNATECPVYFTLYDPSGRVMYNYSAGRGDDHVNVYLSITYNFNGNYTAVLTDYFGAVIDTYNFTLYSGPLVLVNHTEDLTYYDWGNTTNLYSFTLQIRNEGNARYTITNCTYTIAYASNGSVAFSGADPWVYEVVGPGEVGNISLYPNVDLMHNQTYTITVEFRGKNTEVVYSVSFQIRA